MIATLPPETHGGDVHRIAREFGIPKNALLDFSASINPRGLPPRAAERLAREAIDPNLLAQYPDPEAREMRQLLGKQLGVPHEAIVVGDGAGALIDACVRALKPRKCLIPVPAFYEYERTCRVNNCFVHPFPLAAENGFTLDPAAISHAIRQNACDLLIVNNPHNPSGAGMDRAMMLYLLELTRAAGAKVVIDEAFIDYAPGSEITADAVLLSGVVAVRSLTKFYGCPALRVAYLVAAPDIARLIAAQVPVWPVTTLALNTLAEALKDTAYSRLSIEENELERIRLSRSLAELGFQVFPSVSNFLLLHLPENRCSAQLRERLIVKHNIVVRNCDSFAALAKGRYIRVAVKSERDNNRLLEAISKCLVP